MMNLKTRTAARLCGSNLVPVMRQKLKCLYTETITQKSQIRDLRHHFTTHHSMYRQRRFVMDHLSATIQLDRRLSL